MKSVLFFIESLDGGGAEAALTKFVKLSHPADLRYTVVSEEEYPESEIPHRFFMNRRKTVLDKVKGKLSLTLPESWSSRMILREQADVTVAFCEGFATQVVAYSPFQTKKVAWVHTDVVNNPWSEKVLGGYEKERACYERMDAIVCVSETMRNAFIEKYGMADKVRVLYNVYDEASIRALAAEPIEPDDRRPVFTMAGRLTQVKGYDRIIRVAAKLKAEGFSFRIKIMGRGVLEKTLREQIEQNGLTQEVVLLGYQKNPYAHIARSDLFLCSSYAEGYSTAVSEAILLGVPAIVTECSGMREIFGGRDCGVICENSEEGLYAALKRVLQKPELLRDYAAQAKERAADFSMQKRLKEIEDFLADV